jgi:hypothetical protein
MLRSLALPFTVMEWALPPVPRSAAAAAASARKSTLLYRDRPTIASAVAAANAPLLSPTSPSTSDSLQESESAESFAFALVNGSLGVFEMRGRRVRDFKPRWPAAAFVSADVLVTAMAYRTPHVVIPFCNLYLPISWLIKLLLYAIDLDQVCCIAIAS